ncbi:MAG: hypothetical protein J6N72_10625 [Psychrobacter sp.]|nr:hypothetical protein [Psychrobacter sp.]
MQDAKKAFQVTSMSKTKTSNAEQIIEAFYKSSFTTYLDLNFMEDFIASIGGAVNFLENVDFFITDGANINSLTTNWTESSLILFEKYRAVCVDSAAYWEFNGDRVMTIERLNAEKKFDIMLMSINHKLINSNLASDGLFTIDQVKDSISNKKSHYEQHLLDKLVADYCVGCLIALSCWGFKGFLREG